MTATAPAPVFPTTSPTAPTPTPIAGPSSDPAKRIDRLERQVTTLRKRIRRYERSNPPFEITPEMAAYVDELEAKVVRTFSWPHSLCEGK